MGDETTEGTTRRRDDDVAPTMPAPVGDSNADLRDAFEHVFDRPGGGADGAGTSDQSGSPNQPGLTPSQKQQVHQDRLKEQTDSDTPSDRDESSVPEPGDPAQSPGTSSPGNWVSGLEEGLGKALDEADSVRARTPESVTGGVGADTARSAPTDQAQSDSGDLMQAGEDFAAITRATGDPIGAGADAISDGTVTDAAQEAMDTVGDTAGDAFTDASDVAGDAFGAIGDATGDMTDVAGDAFDTGADMAGDAFDAVADTTSDMVDTAADMLLE